MESIKRKKLLAEATALLSGSAPFQRIRITLKRDGDNVTASDIKPINGTVDIVACIVASPQDVKFFNSLNVQSVLNQYRMNDLNLLPSSPAKIQIFRFATEDDFTEFLNV